MKKLKDKIKQLTIKEDEWGVGALYANGEYCALGFLGKAAGLSDNDMASCGLPGDVDYCPEWLRTLLHTECKNGRRFQSCVVKTNDTAHLTPAQKKKDLKSLFKEVGIDLHFKGKNKETT